jgi:hypothetical protein
MARNPAKLSHVKKFNCIPAFQPPNKKQVNYALEHHEDPVALWATAQPEPEESNVELPQHEGARAQALLPVTLGGLLNLSHGSVQRTFFDSGALSFELGSLPYVKVQIGGVAGFLVLLSCLRHILLFLFK